MKFSSLKNKIDNIIAYFIEKNNWFEDDATINEKLHIGDGYIVERIILKENSKRIGKTVLQVNQELDKRLIIGIERYEKWIALPQNDTVLALHDIVVVYGKAK